MRERFIPLVFLGSALGCGDGTVAPPTDGRPVIAITVDEKGYTPAEVKAKSGEPVRLVFTRMTDAGCGQQLGVDITMPTSGKITFACGMDMYQGAVVVE